MLGPWCIAQNILKPTGTPGLELSMVSGCLERNPEMESRLAKRNEAAMYLEHEAAENAFTLKGRSKSSAKKKRAYQYCLLVKTVLA